MSNTAKVIIENVPAFASGVKAICKGLSALMVGAGITYAAMSLGEYYSKKAKDISDRLKQEKTSYGSSYYTQFNRNVWDRPKTEDPDDTEELEEDE